MANKIPQWAQDLTIETCLYLESKGFNSELPLIKWRHRVGKTTSGMTYNKFITINAGSDHKDCKLVLLHELAHWALPLKSGHEGHTPKFWELANG
jgi:hypothetical protein